MPGREGTEQSASAPPFFSLPICPNGHRVLTGHIAGSNWTFSVGLQGIGSPSSIEWRRGALRSREPLPLAAGDRALEVRAAVTGPQFAQPDWRGVGGADVPPELIADC